MSEKKMLIVEEELLNKIDENRGEMSRSEFISFIINNQLEEEAVSAPASSQYISRKEYVQFTQEMKDLLRRFLDFFISNGLKQDEQPKDGNYAELAQMLEALSASRAKPKKLK